MKTLLKIVLWSLTFIAASAVAKQPNLIDHGLQSDFLEYNDQFFYGALPKTATVQWADLSEYKDMGRSSTRADGSVVIQVDPKMHAVLKQADMTLLHEMCHVKVGLHINIITGTNQEESEGFDGHGAAFEACMVDIAKRGAFKDLW